MSRHDCIVVGASGYVGAEILRLLAGHPLLDVVGLYSRTARADVGELHPHLDACYGGLPLEPLDRLAEMPAGERPLAAFLAVPHGESARLAALLTSSARPCTIVDAGADFRLETPDRFEEVYGVEHGAPALFDSFHCGLPDLDAEPDSRHAAHPGCFTTSVCLGLAPLVAAGLLTDRIVASCVTGSSGSGAAPKLTTHHPRRHGSLSGYGAFGHRHRHEMRLLLERLGTLPDLTFLPHSGPFVRGIHATLSLRLTAPSSAAELVELFSDYYAHTPFVTALERPPALGEVRGGNHARIGIAVDGSDAVVYVAIDNLVKGAAGGAVQWMNRLLGLEPWTGLDSPALAWS